MKEEEYAKIFQRLNMDNYQEYRDSCLFFFEDDPKECLDYLEKRSRAWDGGGWNCTTKTCCKEKAGSDDEKYRDCVKNIKQGDWKLIIFIVMIMIIIIIVIIKCIF